MVVGLALRGLGKALLKKGGKKGGDAAKKFLERRRVFGNAAFKSDIVQTTAKAKKLIKSIKEATARTQKQIDMMKGKKK
tara:strand:+ start:306 stop:542 length:237 start_codon:yes stop_codon:yes gene_type:complete